MTEMAKESYFKGAVALLAGTVPILVMNLAIYAAFFLAALVWFAFWGGLGLFLARFAAIAGVICLIIAVGAGGWGWRMAKRYLLYLVKGAHIAAMTEMLCGREVPKGPGQVAYSRAIMEDYFKDVSQLFFLDGLVKGAVKGLTGSVVKLTRIIPLPLDFRKLINLIRMLVNRSLSYVDEAILSYAISRRETNVWRSAADGVVLYGQSYKPILTTTVKVWALGKIFGVVAFVGLVVPALAIGALTGNTIVVIFAFLAAVAGARLAELALYEPFALAYTMVTFYHETDGVEPDPEWKSRIEGLSDEFRELTAKAKTFAREQGVGGSAAGEDEPAPAHG